MNPQTDGSQAKKTGLALTQRIQTAAGAQKVKGQVAVERKKAAKKPATKPSA